MPMTHQCGWVPGACMPAAMRTSVMMPIVFWPSEVPWARASIDDEMR